MHRFFIVLVLLTPISSIAQDHGFLSTPEGLPYITSETYRSSMINDAVTLEEIFDSKSWLLLEKKLGESKRILNDTTFVEITKAVEYDGLTFLYTNYPGELELTKITITGKNHFIRISGQRFRPFMTLSDFIIIFGHNFEKSQTVKIYVGSNKTHIEKGEKLSIADGVFFLFYIDYEKEIVSKIELVRSFI